MADENCLTKTVGGGLSGVVVGGSLGAIHAAWIMNPLVKDQTGPMLRLTGNIIRNQASVFGAVGAVYMGTECAVEAVRGESDFLNAAVAGCAAGSLFGLQYKSPAMGVGACAAMAFTAAVVDLVEGRIVPKREGTLFVSSANLENEKHDVSH